MKQTLFTLVLLISTSTLFAQSKLIGYFNQLPEACKKGFVITKSGKNYTADAGTGSCKVYLDETNGFMQIKDSGTGGGTLVFQLAVFTTSDKKNVVIVNSYVYGDVRETGSLRFFSGDKSFEEINEKDILPDMTLVQDLSYTAVSETDLSEYQGEQSYIYFELPQKGTTLKFFYGSNSLDQACSEKDQKACDIKAKIKPIELFWHKETSSFSTTK